MDFYSNETIARAEMQHRIAGLQRDATRSVATEAVGGSDNHSWALEFAAWAASRARIGATFMARTPTNP